MCIKIVSGQGSCFLGGVVLESKPVELNEEIGVEILELSPKNEGISKVQGYVVCVADAKVGVHIQIKITK